MRFAVQQRRVETATSTVAVLRTAPTNSEIGTETSEATMPKEAKETKRQGRPMKEDMNRHKVESAGAEHTKAASRG